jgi:hypothetical protein
VGKSYPGLHVTQSSWQGGSNLSTHGPVDCCTEYTDYYVTVKRMN